MTRDLADDAFGCEPQHEKEGRAEEQQLIFGKAGEQLRQQHDHDGADQRTERRARTANDHDQQEHDRLREREPARADEACERREHAAGKPRRERREGECHDAHGDRIEPEALTGDLGRPHRAHGAPPGAAIELAKRMQRNDRKPD